MPGRRVEEVQRHLVRVELGEVRGEFGALLEGFAHAEDAAAAHLHARLADHAQGVPALFPGVGGDDVGEERPRRLQVVVVAVHAHLGEPLDLLLGEHAQRAGDLDVDLVADRLDARGDLRQQPLVGSADGGDDAELGRAGLGGLLGRLDQARDVQPRAAHRRREEARLRTEVAVLGAAAGLEADDALDLDVGPAPRHPHLVREREQLVEPVVGQLQHPQRLVLVQALAALQYLLASLRQNVAHPCPPPT